MDIVIFTTGGTIDKVYFDRKSEFQVGSPQITEVLAEANVTLDFQVVPLMRKDSLELTAEDRATIRASRPAPPVRNNRASNSSSARAATPR